MLMSYKLSHRTLLSYILYLGLVVSPCFLVQILVFIWIFTLISNLKIKHFFKSSTHLQYLDHFYYRFFLGLTCPSGLIMLFLIKIPWNNEWPLLPSLSFSPASLRQKMLLISISLFPRFLFVSFACYSFSYTHTESVILSRI